MEEQKLEDLLKMIDTDQDGMPDWWETDHFGNLVQGPSGDADDDGFTNLDEFFAGTGPLNASSHLSFSSMAVLKDGIQTHFVLSFPSIADRLYQIEWSGTMLGGSWQPLGQPVIGTGATLQVQDSNAINAANKRFYRMSLLPD